MKNLILVFGLLMTMNVLSAQFYTSLSGGYALGVGKETLGQEVTVSSQEDLEGSYGEGIYAQLRLGYYVTPNLAVDLGLGYLHGRDHDVAIVKTPATNSEIQARARAFGASLGLLYDITDNIYVRGCAVTKVAGQTEAEGHSSQVFPAQLFNPNAGEAEISVIEADFTRDFNGKFSVGFLLAAGYSYDITENIAIFGEVEYLNLKVKNNKSDLNEVTATLDGNSISKEQIMAGVANLPAESQAAFYKVFPIVGEITYVENPTKPNEGQSKKSPYSSLGLNFGVKFSF